MEKLTALVAHPRCDETVFAHSNVNADDDAVAAAAAVHVVQDVAAECAVCPSSWRK